MFSGIIKEIGILVGFERTGNLLRYAVNGPLTSARSELGASVAVDGVCQTVVARAGTVLHFEAVDETLKKTTLAGLHPGQSVHLEASLRLGDPVDGHLVTGHVDGVGIVESAQPGTGRHDLCVRVPASLERYLIKAGSITLAGVALTLYDVQGALAFVTLIPETLRRTHLGNLRPGDAVNVEVDMIGKWIEKLLAARLSGP